MPIGTVDYRNTAPWNDPYNPWPACSRLMLSAADYRLGGGVPFAYDLDYFVPTTEIGATAWSYTSIDYTYDGLQTTLILSKDSVSDASYTAQVKFDNDTYYYVNGMIRKDITAGYVQGNTLWQADNGDDPATLSIIPVTTWLTPWEHRRRWCLNG